MLIEKKLEDWKVTDKRFVAILDILGFKDMVARENHQKILNRLRELSSYSITIAESDLFNGTLHVVIFSDSIYSLYKTIVQRAKVA